MTLPKRLVSLLLVYCFVVSISANKEQASHSGVRVPTSVGIFPQVQSPTEVGALTPLRRAYDFLSVLSSSNQTTSSDDEGADKEEGLRFRLSEAPGQPEARPVSKVAKATMLSDAETQAILSRLPPIKAEPSDEAEFALREKSLPPPRTGATLLQPFPAPNEMAGPDQKATGPLEVVRYSPEGDVPIAPSLSVTFSEAMVAVSSQEEAAENVPVRLSPQPPGKWHWIGTKTLLFEPDVRFPMATQYSVNVPAGTKSANGGTLGSAKTWTFTTPPLTVKSTSPDRQFTQRLDKLMFVEFDQRIDPLVVIKTIKVLAGKTELPTRLATKEEVDADEDVRDAVRNAEKGRWIAFRAIDANGDTKFALPADTSITVAVEPGTPSSEGPLLTARRQDFTFRTLAPMRLTNAQCGNVNTRECTPYDQWRIDFSNKIKPDAFEASQVRVEPPIDGMKAIVSWNGLTIEGSKKPETIYRVTIDKSLRDQFDQTLGRDETVEFKVGPARAWIGMSGQGFVVLDPAGPRQLSLYSVNYQTVKLSLYAVEPSDWALFQIYRQLHYRGPNDAAAKKATLPGRLVSSKRIDLKTSPNEMIETAIDLTPVLKEGFGQALVAVESITPASDNYHSPLLAWVQSTKIGLDAFVDNDALVGWATSLADGAPLGDVQMQIIPSDVSGATGADGLAHLPLKPVSDSALSVLVARRGNDVAILPENADNWWATTGSWQQKPQPDELRWYVFDDRKLYRPGEEVHIKGWLRRVGAGKRGDVALPGDVATATDIVYTLKDSNGNEIKKAGTRVGALGGFDMVLKLPLNINLGSATLALLTNSNLAGANFEHHFEVEEFRRPEFEVTART